MVQNQPKKCPNGSGITRFPGLVSVEQHNFTTRSFTLKLMQRLNFVRPKWGFELNMEHNFDKYWRQCKLNIRSSRDMRKHITFPWHQYSRGHSVWDSVHSTHCSTQYNVGYYRTVQTVRSTVLDITVQYRQYPVQCWILNTVHCTVWAIKHITLYSMGYWTQYSTVMVSTVQFSTDSTVKYSTIQYSTVQ